MNLVMEMVSDAWVLFSSYWRLRRSIFSVNGARKAALVTSAVLNYIFFSPSHVCFYFFLHSPTLHQPVVTVFLSFFTFF